MSDVRLVRLNEINLAEYGGDMTEITDDPNGTHLLVPVDRVFEDPEYQPLWIAELDKAKACPTCGGSGYKPGWIDGMADREAVAVKCPDCNGRGWVLNGGDDE